MFLTLWGFHLVSQGEARRNSLHRCCRGEGPDRMQGRAGNVCRIKAIAYP